MDFALGVGDGGREGLGGAVDGDGCRAQWAKLLDPSWVTLVISRGR